MKRCLNSTLFICNIEFFRQAEVTMKLECFVRLKIEPYRE